MTDRRLLAANHRVAAFELRGMVDAPRFSDGAWHRTAPAVTDLRRAPNGPRDRQLLHGQRVRVLDIDGDWAFLQSPRDGYVGYVAASALAADASATHVVSARATHLYPAPDLKTHEAGWLSHGSLLTITGENASWCETDGGHFLPTVHLAPVDRPATDPAEVASLYLGTPYLWGGNSSAGIDCSGLVQAALIACGHPCPGDSDQQCDALGARLAPDTPPKRGDLFFWQGHVALAVDATTLIHANAHHMAVAYEPIAAALDRIAAKEFGALIAHKRLG